MILFDTPHYLNFALALLMLLVLFINYRIWQNKTQKRFAQNHHLKKLAPNSSSIKKGIKFLFSLLTMGGLIIALANPKTKDSISGIRNKGVTVVFALDISKSMLCQDIAPNRLEKAKQIIYKTIDQLGNDKVGIIVYAGNSYPLLPITTDLSSARMFLNNCNTDMISYQGTAIEKALARAENFFSHSDTKSTFLVILSDGEDHKKNSIAGAKKIADLGTNIITIGIGTEQGSAIPDIVKGIDRGLKKDKQGEVVITKRDSEVLQNIARVSTTSFYIDGNDTNRAVSEISEAIHNAEKTNFEAQKTIDYRYHFQWFLGFALCWLLIDFFTVNKKIKWL